MSNSNLRTSARGIALIHSFESCARLRPDGRYEAYPDPGSKDGHPWTIGWGSTGEDPFNGGMIRRGTIWTKAQCDERFAQHLAHFEAGVRRLIGSAPTTQGQFDALVSFAYNVGLDIDADTKAEGLGDSTLLRRHLAGDYAGAARQFLLWNKNDGVVMRGLTRRRKAEVALYQS